jgi:hypothetical protein
MLLVAVVLAFFLTTRLFHGAAPGPAFRVGQLEGTPCPSGVGVPACYRVDVQNVGRDPGVATCVLESVEGALATFSDGTVEIETPAVLPDSAASLLVTVQAGVNASAPPPSISCETMSAL